jgi:hypothetical protein
VFCKSRSVRKAVPVLALKVALKAWLAGPVGHNGLAAQLPEYNYVSEHPADALHHNIIFDD